MFEYKRPKFPKGPLRVNVLNNMRDIAVMEADIRYSGYSDGIISGCELVEQNMQIGVKCGVVKFAGRLYTLPAQETVPYQPTDEWTILKIRFGPEVNDRDFTLYQGQLVLDNDLQLSRGEMELGRFKLKQGSRLRTSYRDFRDLITEYDTVNLVHVRQASPGTYTLSPVITRFFAQEAYTRADEYLDMVFCSQCLASTEPVRREYMVSYINKRSNSDLDLNVDNAEIHRCLSDILDDILGRAKIETKRPNVQGIELY